MGRVATVEMLWPEAESALNGALALSPGNTNALSALAGLMGILDRKEERLVLALRAVV